MSNRRETWERLDNEHFDLLIIGGGITGCGAVRDAARRGLKVALVEAVDFAFGTSSRSSKLVHGGLRYLEHREFSLVFEAVSERRTLMNIAPHLVNPLPFLFPVYENSRVGLGLLRAGMWLYDALALFRSPKIHKTLSVKDLRKTEPLLNADKLKGAPLYYDCATDDARLTLESALDAIDNGAVITNYARVTGLIRDENGRIAGARIRNQLSGGGEVEIKATAVINATGPWSDRTRALGSAGEKVLRPTKGVHIVVQSTALPVRHAVVCTHPEDGRVLFAIPWGGQTYIGTTDTDYEGDPADVAATRSDVDYLIDATNSYFPSSPIGPDDVICTWAGLRPLIHQEGSTATVSREHTILVDPDGLITIAGGKLTTYRRMGAEVVSRALDVMALLDKVPEGTRDAQTGREPLPGAVGWPEDDDHSKVVAEILEVAQGAVTEPTAWHLADRYGTCGIDIAKRARDDQALRATLVPGRPEIMAIVDYAVARELAVTLSDIMVRRTQLFFRDDDQGLQGAEAIADRMALLLGWDEQRKTEEVLAYQAEVARSRRWRSE